MFCRSLTNVTVQTIDAAADLDGLLRLMGRHNETRYCKLNLSSYRRHGTVEFRQHSGTLDAGKAKQWTMFCLRMIAAAQAGRLGVRTTSSEQQAPAQINRGRPGSKTRLVGQLCLRPEGVTLREALAATGWRQMSMPPVLRACGLTYTTQTTGRTMRYFARATAASTSSVASATLDNLFDVLECDELSRQYFRTRTADLSGPVEWAA
jgi:hypothetical protein